MLVHLQESFVYDQVSGGEVKGAILTELSIPVLTPWAVGWVQVERLGQLPSYKEIRLTVCCSYMWPRYKFFCGKKIIPN